MPKIEHLLWCDLETTGTDEKKDPILEIAVALTTVADLDPIWSYSEVCNPTQTNWRDRLSVEVHRMHYESGLLGEVATARRDYVVEAHIVDHLRLQHVRKHTVVLAGSGVGHFDKRFIQEQMPLLFAYLAYPVIDVGVMRRFVGLVAGRQDLVPSLNAKKNHRAAEDLALHLKEARAYQDILQRAS